MRMLSLMANEQTRLMVVVSFIKLRIPFACVVGEIIPSSWMQMMLRIRKSGLLMQYFFGFTVLFCQRLCLTTTTLKSNCDGNKCQPIPRWHPHLLQLSLSFLVTWGRNNFKIRMSHNDQFDELPHYSVRPSPLGWFFFLSLSLFLCELSSHWDSLCFSLVCIKREIKRNKLRFYSFTKAKMQMRNGLHGFVKRRFFYPPPQFTNQLRPFQIIKSIA